jgi:hypothetical protein
MYTALLAFALIAVLLSILFLWLYMKDAYDNKMKSTAMAACATQLRGEERRARGEWTGASAVFRSPVG